MKKKFDKTAVLKYVLDKYGVQPDYPWDNLKDAGVLRHSENRKWFGLIMSVSRDKVGLKGGGTVDVLNLKCDPITGGSAKLNKGVIPAYHMSKSNWISVILDGSVDRELAEMLIDISFDLTAPKTKRREASKISEWIVPANPRFYDIEKAVNEAVSGDKTFLWKQAGKAAVGDTVYLYVAAPISAIICKCEAVEVNIPYNYSDDNLSMSSVMKLKILTRYDKDPVTFAMLKEYGVTAVRGPRSIPKELVKAIEKLYK